MLLAPLLAMVDGEEEKLKFEKLYYTYVDFVMGISYSRLGDRLLAEDNAQEVFYAVARNFDKIGEINSKATKSYIYTITTSLAINKYKKEKKEQLKITEIEKYTDISDKTFDIYSETELKSVLEVLTDEEKAYLRLKYLYGYTSREIAGMFNESPSNVRRKISIILLKLKESLGEENE